MTALTPKSLKARLHRTRHALVRGRTLVIGIPFVWLILFFLVPFLVVLGISFREMEGAFVSSLFQLDNIDTAEFTLKLRSYILLFTDSYYWNTYAHSIMYAAITTMGCLVIGYPFAYFMARAPKFFQPFLFIGIMVPFWTNFLLRVYAWRGLLESNTGWISILLDTLGLDQILLSMGLINTPGIYLYTPLSLLLGMTYTYLPFMILPLYTTLTKMDNRLLEAAQDLGATPWYSFWKITVPLSKTGIIAGSMLVFIPCVGEYVIPELLGSPEILMIGRVLWDAFFRELDWPMACALTVMMLLIIVIPMGILNQILSKEEAK